MWLKIIQIHKKGKTKRRLNQLFPINFLDEIATTDSKNEKSHNLRNNSNLIDSAKKQKI